jgi:hypothetical protein
MSPNHIRLKDSYTFNLAMINFVIISVLIKESVFVAR